MQKEIDHLFTNYRKLQNKILTDSPLYKELVSLANKNTPRITEPLISKNQWKLIVNEITSIYPNLYNYLFSLCPTLSDEDFQYCCFYLYGFDTNVEAKLLNIAIGSVSRKHTRLKGKLNITLPSNSTLYEYLMYFFPFISFYVPVEHPRFSRVSPVFRKKGRTTTIIVI